MACRSIAIFISPLSFFYAFSGLDYDAAAFTSVLRAAVTRRCPLLRRGEGAAEGRRAASDVVNVGDGRIAVSLCTGAAARAVALLAVLQLGAEELKAVAHGAQEALLDAIERMARRGRRRRTKKLFPFFFWRK